jgi:hypothetical protein
MRHRSQSDQGFHPGPRLGYRIIYELVSEQSSAINFSNCLVLIVGSFFSFFERLLLAKIGSVFDTNGLLLAKIGSVFDTNGLLLAKIGSVFDTNGLLFPTGAFNFSIPDSA